MHTSSPSSSNHAPPPSVKPIDIPLASRVGWPPTLSTTSSAMSSGLYNSPPQSPFPTVGDALDATTPLIATSAGSGSASASARYRSPPESPHHWLPGTSPLAGLSGTMPGVSASLPTQFYMPHMRRASAPSVHAGVGPQQPAPASFFPANSLYAAAAAAAAASVTSPATSPDVLGVARRRVQSMTSATTPPVAAPGPAAMAMLNRPIGTVATTTIVEEPTTAVTAPAAPMVRGRTISTPATTTSASAAAGPKKRTRPTSPMRTFILSGHSLDAL
ncbi:hypothetical protein H9P43_007782 [Blastocladiella emersonii ATCC 22665]|nr:hypothetical protein H9P43_007782 [Blastocladiella emersonii ATCC 22665]